MLQRGNVSSSCQQPCALLGQEATCSQEAAERVGDAGKLNAPFAAEVFKKDGNLENSAPES